jgi:hypothetical protein
MIGAGRGHAHRHAARAEPWDERAVGQHHAVSEGRKHERLPAAVRDAGDADVRADEALVDQESREVLRVADLVAGVGETQPAALAADVGVAERRVGQPCGREAAREVLPARRVDEDRVALRDEQVDLRRRRLPRREPVQVDDERERPVLLERGEREGHVERHAVPALDAVQDARGRADLADAHDGHAGHAAVEDAGDQLRARGGRGDQDGDDGDGA